MNTIWDRLGMSTSILCVIHCLITPVLLMVLPFAGHTLAQGWFHTLIIAIAVPVAVYALWNGYRIHKHASVLWLAAFGFLAIAFAVILSGHNSVESGFMIIAGIFLSTAHYKNLKACRCANT